MRDAQPEDVAGICLFGEKHIPAHYAPLIGEEAAHDQVRTYWNEAHVASAVARGLVVVAERQGEVVGVGQRGPGHVIYKLYVHPELRGHGLGPRLIDALCAHMDAEVVLIEHFVQNERAGAFYEREGFTVQRVENGIVWRSRPLTRL
ncbi:Ribosomal protein S18 acetylase RimI [Lentzea fradiae]|uniref:Ribosomal protein S18 acetylase RimI n=1 Tax=Lentzea fradiae TaxID=200378 RepID=A0A1G7RMN2_9PSEU|nr:Ribosomal protein S18 acetylase RimI [Lentzea fradiae]